MKNLFLFISIFTFALFFTSCGNEPTQEEADEAIEEVLAPFTDDANAEITAADTSSTGVYQEEVDETEGASLQDVMKNSSTEPKAEEGGMSFCDCVKKQKELDDIIMGDETSDEDFDKAMADKKALKTGDCKFMFDIKQNTVEAKQAYQRKVKKCL